jgi:phosphomannomutase
MSSNISAPHHFDPTILREYDIRGVVGVSLKRSDVVAVGQAFGTLVRQAGGLRVCLGYDGRLSSPDFAAAAEEGLRKTGLEVLKIGRGPTPMLYFSVYALEADAGMMITGSHNPPEYNGIKMTLGKASVYGAVIQQLGQIAAQGAYIEGQGQGREIDITKAYIERLCQDYTGHPERPLTVAWDAGNGAGGEMLEQLVKKLPGQHHLLYTQIDGHFPNHHPDPTIETNLTALKAQVRDKACDLGIAFDGDADRIGVVDETGTVIWGDQLVGIYAHEILAQTPGAIIMGDVKCSQAMFDMIHSLGGRPLMWKTGHSLMKAKMAECGAPLAGEMSGHICFADKFYGYDDALYDAVRLISLLSRAGLPASSWRKKFPATVSTPEIRFAVGEARKFAIVEEVAARVKARSLQDGLTINDIDGVRVSRAEGWWLLRASNTQDVLTLRVEARDEVGLARLIGDLTAELTQSGVSTPDFTKPSGH